MKKIINRKIYNTETATEMGKWYTPGISTNDFNYAREVLYRTKKGAWFLYGEGHGFTRWATVSGNTRGWGENIVPMTEDDARTWAEEKLDAEEYIGIFGEPEEA